MTYITKTPPRRSLVLCDVSGRYVFEKTFRVLLQRMTGDQAEKYLPARNREDANWQFRELLVGFDPEKYAYKWPREVDEWREIFEKIAPQISLSRQIVVGEFPDKIKPAHAAIMERKVGEISAMQDWLYYNQPLLRDLVSEFSN